MKEEEDDDDDDDERERERERERKAKYTTVLNVFPFSAINFLCIKKKIYV